MLYPVAHSFFNGQSKNSNLFPLPQLHEMQFKRKNPWSSGDENVKHTANLVVDPVKLFGKLTAVTFREQDLSPSSYL